VNPLTESKIILVIRETRLDQLIARYNTLEQARFYVEHLNADFSDYVQEDMLYKRRQSEAEAVLAKQGRLQVLARRYLSNFIFGKEDIIVVLGQDGLVANTLKYLQFQKVIGLNPDPLRWDGILLPFQVEDLSKIIPEVIGSKRQVQNVTMAKVELNDGQELYAVNDFYIGAQSHVSSRYSLNFARESEQQSSSGIIVSTGLGASGWFKSVLAGAQQLARVLSHSDLNLQVQEPFRWDSKYLYFTVREPFPSRSSSASIVFGKVTKNKPLKVISMMSEKGVIFSDGMENDFLSFNSGIEATIFPAGKQGHLVV